MKNILITGGAGFIGANFIQYILKKYPEYKIINLDKLTYAADKSNLSNIEHHENYRFIQGDILDLDLINDVFGQYNITDLIHFAAESHVDNSIVDPSVFVQTNVLGTYNLLQAAKNYWPKNSRENIFYHVSTDEVYGSLGEKGYFTEESNYQPNSPYSASKAASDHLVRSYFKTYELNTRISNCSNNFGPYQHKEKLIPTIIRHLLKGSPVPIYGTGNNIRDWIYVLDHCQAIEAIFHHAQPGAHYNIGGNCELKNTELVKMIADRLYEKQLISSGFNEKNMIQFVTDRKGHDFRYAISNNKINQELNWYPSNQLDYNLLKTIDFYVLTQPSP